MICEKCGKQQASVHMTQIINGVKEEIHLCEDCAREESFYNPVSFQDFFKGFFNMPVINQGYTNTNELPKDDSFRCSECGLTYDDFRRIGKFGCADCYNVFRPYLNTALKSIHGGDLHKGKFPKKGGSNLIKKREKQELKRKLAVAIEKEEFEEAAKIRDRLKSLEKED